MLRVRERGASWVGHRVSALGASIGKAVGGLGGPGVVAALVAGGILVGALGGGVVALQGKGQPASATGKLAVYACPESGAPLLMIAAGQKLLVTGRTADGAWLRIHFPEPGRTEAWVQASPLQVDGAVAGLPVAGCMAELAVAAPSLEPGMTLTAVANNPPTSAPTATPTAAPTAGPTGTPNTAPSLSALTVSTGRISYDTGGYCPTAVKKATFRVKAADRSGLAGVTLFWREPGASTYAQSPMSRASGSATNGTWQATLDTTANGITKAGKLAFYALGTDTSGATRRIPAGSSNAISVVVCANTGPAITSARSSSGSSLSWNPLGAPGSCQTATDITAVVKDPDGVKSVTLFYRRPGSSTWQSKPMNNTTIPGRWYANLDTLGDTISIPTPPTGTLRWYIKAVDGKNAARQTGAAAITVRRCDSEAQIGRVLHGGTGLCSAISLTIFTSAADADQPENGLKVVFYWRISTPVGVPFHTPISGHFPADTTKGTSYQGTSRRSVNATGFAAGALEVWAVTTDKYNGSTTSTKYTSGLACQ